MDALTMILNRLKAEQQKYALEALRCPQAKDAYEYGHRCGTIAGIEMAINVLINTIDEQQNGNNDL